MLGMQSRRVNEGGTATDEGQAVWWISVVLETTLKKMQSHKKVMVSAAGLEPATHALKGHCSTN